MNSSSLNITAPYVLPPLNTSLDACNPSVGRPMIFNASAIPPHSSYCQVDFPYLITNMSSCCNGPVQVYNNCTQWCQTNSGEDGPFASCVHKAIDTMGYNLSSYEMALAYRCGNTTEKGMSSGGERNRVGFVAGFVVVMAALATLG